MKCLSEITEDIKGGISSSGTPEALSAIRLPACAAALWCRSRLSRFQTWIDNLSCEHLPSFRVTLRASQVGEALLNISNVYGTPDCSERDLLIDDVAALAAIFSNIMRTDYLRVCLHVVAENDCCTFHVDAVTARLVCTYRGTGTQYGNLARQGDPDPVHTVPTGSPIILRGSHWPEVPTSGLLHRSPPIQGTGETRLVLTLEPVENLAEKPARLFMH